MAKDMIVECEEWYFLSLHEVSRSFGVTEEKIIEIVSEGVIEPEKDEKNEWQFNSEALRRIRIILQLNRDLGVNLAGAALVLDLLNEIDRLNQELNVKLEK